MSVLTVKTFNLRVLSSLAGSAPTPSYRFLDISFSLLDDLSSGERNELRLSGELLIRRKGVGNG